MIDILLVLLITFMLLPNHTKGLPAEVPEPATDSQPSVAKPLDSVLRIRKDRSIDIDSQPVLALEVEERLKVLSATRPGGVYSSRARANSSMPTSLRSSISRVERVSQGAFSNRRMSMKIGQGMRRPRSGRLPFFGFWFSERERWLSSRAVVGKWETCFWFSTFPWTRSRAVGMWESRAFCEISKGRWKAWKPALGFPRFPRARHFHRPPLAELRQGRRLALPKQLGLGRAHPASAFGVADRQRPLFQFPQTQSRFQKALPSGSDCSFSNGVRSSLILYLRWRLPRSSKLTVANPQGR